MKGGGGPKTAILHLEERQKRQYCVPKYRNRSYKWDKVGVVNLEELLEEMNHGEEPDDIFPDISKIQCVPADGSAGGSPVTLQKIAQAQDCIFQKFLVKKIEARGSSSSEMLTEIT